MESRNYIGGEWYTPRGDVIHVKNPSNTSEEIGVLHLSEASDMQQAGEAAQKALASWASMNSGKRGQILYQAADLLASKLDEVATLSSLEMGKPISEMKGEVMRGVHLLRYYAAEGVRAVGDVIPAGADNVLQYTKRVPLGVVGLITPWNFPVAIPIWKLAPALICGNTVIWKPAEAASLSATKITAILAEAGLPAGVLNLVIGTGSKVGSRMLEELPLDGVSFTGSTKTGLQVAATCARRNIKYQTEMGGKNAAVVLRDADLSTTVPAILSGAFRSAGQKCTATSRIIVEQAAYEPLVDELRKEVAKLYVGNALDPSSYLGPVASAGQYETVRSYVRLAEQTEVLAQGQAQVDPSTGYYVMPLVVGGVGPDHKLVQEEIFGPVAAVVRATDAEEAFALCNQTMYGLSASVFTQNLSRALRFLDETQAGMVRVNLETAGVEYQAPFGGMKLSSSHTREQGQAALSFYSQVKTCAVYYG
ncbi:aldehyde dehydrogenase family protein [Alicyclobacillus cycloheptanicus]|uniref:Aldehyde dehydrogenase (NAD+) n=1 Tax=Alicyclobacillus cycloheptanicus TaxID=1457 RepID=A0ABT9XGT6_9BACL|nr:aldehyde dehydrogenase family protein [Alicyclobacillus cycloheptanicus]MDQ0189521.1 aldehyde dehydrogenase (NAD+) [Alicyclobacillus cycloheptanicus]WDM01582.1 aldehyde dehydrogenase family protein [Alicyclobacillus cycloheptanicus]